MKSSGPVEMLILPQLRNPVVFSDSGIAPSRATGGAVFVLFMIAALASYVCLSLRPRLDTTGSIFAAFIVAGLFLLYWVRPRYILELKGSIPSGTRTILPFLAFVVPGTFLPEFFLGTPSSGRAAFVVLSSLILFCLFHVAVLPCRLRTVAATILSRLPPITFIVISHFILTTALVIFRHYHFNSVFGEDTGYYNQIFWSTLHGQFFTGSLTLGRYSDPVVSSEFAVHNSPFLFAILPVYSIYPTFYVLLILRNAALSLSSVPLYTVARDRMGPTAAFFLVIVYLLSPNILLQSVGPFYPLQFVAPFLISAFVFFYRGSFRMFILWVLLALTVREEVALTTALFALYALILRRPWRWVLVPAALSVVWWYVSTEFIMSHARIALEDLDELFKLSAAGYNGIVAAVVSEPARFMRLIFNFTTFEYIYALFKPTSVLSMFGISTLFMLPTIGINMIIGAFWKTTLSLSMHYSLLATCCLFIAAVEGVARLGSFAEIFRTRPKTLHIALTLLLLPITILSVKDLISYGDSSNSTLIADFSRTPRHETFRRVLTTINVDPTASVAAPSILLPHLSTRQQLYYVDRLWRYRFADPQYIVLDTDRPLRSERDPNRARYEKLIVTFRGSERHQLIFQERGLEIYKVKEGHK
jgi:uncharacterized membrane protein